MDASVRNAGFSVLPENALTCDPGKPHPIYQRHCVTLSGLVPNTLLIALQEQTTSKRRRKTSMYYDYNGARPFLFLNGSTKP